VPPSSTILDMDQALKARKLGSASARRKRMQAREEQEIHAKERYIEHKRRIMLYDHLADETESSSDKESEDESGTSREDREESVTTPSECSVITPKDTPSAPSDFNEKHSDAIELPPFSERPQLQLLVPEPPVETNKIPAAQPSPILGLQASLGSRSDFLYARYSTILDLPAPVISPTDSTPDLDEDDYSPSPVEVATPISISLPKMRPAVISISGPSGKKRRTIIQSPVKQETRSVSPQPPPTPPRSAKRLSTVSTRSGFLAFEAQPMEVPELPPNASSIIATASRESVVGPLGRSESPAMQRRTSQPLLSAIKTGHSRMTSIKSLIRSPSHNTKSSISSSRPESRSSRPPTSTAEIMDDAFRPFETVPANLYDPVPTTRSRLATSHRPISHQPIRPSTSSGISIQPEMTALPIVPPIPINTPSQSVGKGENPAEIRRKKSFSSLRKRSESIGQAIKFAATKGMGSSSTPKVSQPPQHYYDPPPPPLPQPLNLGPPRQNPSLDLSNFPTPPLPSPVASAGARSIRSRKSVASYSMFPPSPKVGNDRRSGVGLGLGLKV
jgi:hypothetical protein